MNTFVEEHACLHDTNENIISALELSDSNECSKTSKRWNKQTVHYKICVCKGTRDCNVKFNSDFPNEPKEITSTICGNGGHKFYTEAQETTENSTSKTSSKSRSGMGLLLLQALLIIGTLWLSNWLLRSCFKWHYKSRFEINMLWFWQLTE